MEYWPSQHYFGHCGEREWNHNQRSQHSISLLRDVEEHIRLAHRGHGSLQHQLPALRRTQVLVMSQLNLVFGQHFCCYYYRLF